MKNYPGQCHCGASTFVCTSEPLFTQYCHCNKCREVAALSQRESDKKGYSFTAAYLTSNFQIKSDNLEKITKNNANLFLCKSCHTLIYGISIDPSKQAGIGINANNFRQPTSEFFQPVRHIWYADRVVDFDDDLPKYKDAPHEQFGSGEIYNG